MKAIGEAAWEWKRNSREILSIEDAFFAGAKWATRWIPVAEELPGEGEGVMILVQVEGYEKRCGVRIGHRDANTGEWMQGTERSPDRVTHWRSIANYQPLEDL